MKRPKPFTWKRIVLTATLAGWLAACNEQPPPSEEDSSAVSQAGRGQPDPSDNPITPFARRARVPESQHDADEIRVGMSAPLSGPSRDLGTHMRNGVEAYFEQVNARGGIGGRKALRLDFLDDGYEPNEARLNVCSLTQRGAVALLGSVGTPTAARTVGVAEKSETLFFGAMTGAQLLRHPEVVDFALFDAASCVPNPELPSATSGFDDSCKRDASTERTLRHVVNYRASYAQEVEATVTHLVDSGVLPYEVGLFVQNDGFGRDGYCGALAALRKQGLAPDFKPVYGTYERNTMAVSAAVQRLERAQPPPRAVLMIATYGAAAEFIKTARRLLPDTIFVNVSFVGTTGLKDALVDTPSVQGRVFVTQVVPHFDGPLKVAAEFRGAIVPRPKSFVALDGYIVARLFGEALELAHPETSSEALQQALVEHGSFSEELGFPVEFGSGRAQGSDNVWLTALCDHSFVDMPWSELNGGSACAWSGARPGGSKSHTDGE